MTDQNKPIPVGHKKNLETIYRAAKHGALALVDCQEKSTGKSVTVLCAIGWDGKEYQITPFAKMFDGNPYDELNPPDANGGYVRD